ncbi:hypothetical protein [Chamaesiphon sp. OTE_20_metabat_361]|uniref:hypothetical protein n=1 Tax=Chamaesiphon sp. OTE_20_metabat_361 TaxID=2964689 RepID=UPI00286B929A|nr:hypothetical protein [Chamaesiphon sp. OTE_20_metabat_361]
MKITHRIATLSTTTILLSISSLGMVANAQPAPEVVLDRAFRYESSAPTSQGRGLLTSFQGWLGTYQRIRKDGSGYVVVFDRGSLPLDAKFKSNGSIESMTFGCPISRSVSINDAPTDIRQALSKCGGFRS